jgi:hypothetical protein
MWKEVYEKPEETDRGAADGKEVGGGRNAVLGGGKLFTGCNTTGCYIPMCYARIPQGSCPSDPPLPFLPCFLSLSLHIYSDIFITLPQICPLASHTFALNPVPWEPRVSPAASPSLLLTHQLSNPPLPPGTMLPSNVCKTSQDLGKHTSWRPSRQDNRDGEEHGLGSARHQSAEEQH